MSSKPVARVCLSVSLGSNDNNNDNNSASSKVTINTLNTLNMFQQKQQQSRNSGSSTFGGSYKTALAVVPPDEAWDRIQRARYIARDSMYSTWPPAIRFFHPFCALSETQDVALHIAAVIEEYDLSPFEVTLTEWSIIPHAEVMDGQYQDMGSRRSQPTDGTTTTTTIDPEQSSHYPRRRPILSPDELLTQELIAREERIGKEKMADRVEKRRRKLAAAAAARHDAGEQPSVEAFVADNTINTTLLDTPSSVPPADEPAAAFEEFNGPCVICLEPDQESRERLQAVRYLLKHSLNGTSLYADWYTPTSSSSSSSSMAHQSLASLDTTLNRQQHAERQPRRRTPIAAWHSKMKSNDHPHSFRPVVPIAAFASVSDAIPVARKLRKLWEPLTFNVTDLHVLSSRADSTDDIGGSSHNEYTESNTGARDALLEEYYTRSTVAQNGLSSAKNPGMENDFYPSASANAIDDAPMGRYQFGCDALISFIGEEMEMDGELNEEMANLLFEKGEPGGFALRSSSTKSSSATDRKSEVDSTNDCTESLAANSGLSRSLEKWLLEEDEEYDEGTVVVIGRTQLFTGEMRQYVGMPASGILDTGTALGTRDGAASRRRRSKGLLTKEED